MLYLQDYGSGGLFIICFYMFQFFKNIRVGSGEFAVALGQEAAKQLRFATTTTTTFSLLIILNSLSNPLPFLTLRKLRVLFLNIRSASFLADEFVDIRANKAISTLAKTNGSGIHF